MGVCHLDEEDLTLDFTFGLAKNKNLSNSKPTFLIPFQVIPFKILELTCFLFGVIRRSMYPLECGTWR